MDDPSVEDLREAVDDAAGVAGTLWISYIFVLFYLLLAIAGISHQNQFLQDDVKLPFLQIELPMLGFFFVGPIIVLLTHAYVLHHVTLLADKARALNKRASEAERVLLGINLFAQMLAGPTDRDSRAAWWVEQVIAWVTLVIAPVLTLLYFELQFLPSHNEGLTWWARACLLGDLALLVWLWPQASCRGDPGWRQAELKPWGIGVMVAVGAVASYIALFVATFPGELIAPVSRYAPLHQTLVSGAPDADQRLHRPIWPNRLFVSGVDVVDRSKYDSPAKLATAQVTKSMRGRHLERAVIEEAQLARADFTSAHLQGASILRTHAMGAWFDGADLSGAQLDDAEFQGASFFAARMAGATLGGTQLQGARLAGADLQAAWLKDASLDGASLASADLRRATLDGASLVGANLNEAGLQGASLAGAQLEAASLDRAYTWKADFRGVSAGQGMRYDDPKPDQDPPCVVAPAGACDPAETLDRLYDIIERNVPKGANKSAQQARLQASLTLDVTEPWEATSQAALKALPRLGPSSDYVEIWERIACPARGAPYVIEILIDTYADDLGWTRPTSSPDREKLGAFLADTTKCTASLVELPPALKMGLRDLKLVRLASERAAPRP